MFFVSRKTKKRKHPRLPPSVLTDCRATFRTLANSLSSISDSQHSGHTPLLAFPIGPCKQAQTPPSKVCRSGSTRASADPVSRPPLFKRPFSPLLSSTLHTFRLLSFSRFRSGASAVVSFIAVSAYDVTHVRTHTHAPAPTGRKKPGPRNIYISSRSH